jgi:hypothetical protein
MNDSLGQILEIKDLIESKQFSKAKKELKNLKSYYELKRIFKFQILIQNKKTTIKKFEPVYYDNLEFFQSLGKKNLLILFHNLAGDYYFDKNKFGHAVNDYECCLKIDRGNSHAIMGLAKSYRLLGLYQISEIYYLKIAHSYDWNFDYLENDSESDITTNYASLREIIEKKNFRFLSKNVLVDIGVLYASNSDKLSGNTVFEAILATSEQNILDSSYFVEASSVSNRIYDEIDERKTRTENPLHLKTKFVIEIKNYFPDFFEKYEREINKGKFPLVSKIDKLSSTNKKFIKKCSRGVITVPLNNSTFKLFFIHKREQGKNNFVYTIASESQRFEEMTSALFLYLSGSNSIENLMRTINIESKYTTLPPEEIVLNYLRCIEDNLSLFLFKKKLYDEGYEKSYPFFYLKKSNQIIKEIMEDEKFEDKLIKLNTIRLDSFRKDLEKSWEDYSKLPELVKNENQHIQDCYKRITEFCQIQLKYLENKEKSKKTIKT